jgi:hypothetical protein
MCEASAVNYNVQELILEITVALKQKASPLTSSVNQLTVNSQKSWLSNCPSLVLQQDSERGHFLPNGTSL